MSTFLIRPATSPSSSYPIVLTRLGGPHSKPNSHLKLVEVPGIEPATSWSVVRHATIIIIKYTSCHQILGLTEEKIYFFPIFMLKTAIYFFLYYQFPPSTVNASTIFCFSYHHGDAYFFFPLLSFPSSILQWLHKEGNFVLVHPRKLTFVCRI